MVADLVFCNFRVLPHPQPSSSSLIYICISSTLSDTTSLFSCLSYQISDFPLMKKKGIGVSLDFSESDKMAALSQLLKATALIPAFCLVSADISLCHWHYSGSLKLLPALMKHCFTVQGCTVFFFQILLFYPLLVFLHLLWPLICYFLRQVSFFLHFCCYVFMCSFHLYFSLFYFFSLSGEVCFPLYICRASNSKPTFLWIWPGFSAHINKKFLFLTVTFSIRWLTDSLSSSSSSV